MSECIFCNIISGQIPSHKVFENDNVYAFADIAPQAPRHILVVPKKHIKSVAEITSENSSLMSACFEAIAEIASSEGLDNGFRVITNSGHDGGQTVNHLHFHILGGKNLGESLL